MGREKSFKIALLLIALIALSSAAIAQERLKLATTTSLYDTKLLDAIEDKFEQKYNVSLDIVSGGTGIAIQYGERGDVDVLIVHDKPREIKFIDDGHGLERRCIAYNYFNVVGPKNDPAGIKEMNASQALKTIMAKGIEDSGKVKFVSRGDNSGTHAREKVLWKNAGINYSHVNTSANRWYLDAGSGMGAALNMANQKNAYTLTDQSTFMAYKGNLMLVPLIKGGDGLLNVYVAMAVNPRNHSGVNCELANKFIDFLVSDEGQDLIANFGKEEYGQTLFFPAKGNCELIGCSEAECAAPTAASCATA
ncbi:MAG: substrate-binding domain-containing protein [Methanotrichaceae archaeon]|nr:substrate-binding domain-containing protein [Methanotrichaceae archaeon]